MKKRILYSYIAVLLFFIFSFLISKFLNTYAFTNIEETDFLSGVGFDVTEKLDEKTYHVPVSIYNFSKNGEISTYLIDSKGETTLQARVDRKLHSGRNISLGSEKIYIFSKRICKDGISVPLDGLLNNAQVTNKSLVVTTNSNPSEILSFKVEGYPSSSHYIHNLLNSLSSFSYISNNETLHDAYIKNTTEGCKFFAPNIDIVNNSLQLTSLTVLDKGKLVASLPIDNLHYLNLLSNKEGTGIVTYISDKNNTISFEHFFNRKIKCKKNDNGFVFDINLKLKGKIVNNNYLSTSEITPYQKAELEKKISEFIKSGLNDFISSMKSDYKLDLINLGNIAAAHYGRNKIPNWDDEILKSTINVNVDFKISKFGIGNINLD
ncbi:MAG: Ger(x)C family spore germination C-terminal domain-containing protein [Clostridium sp.]|uniref:Ger(x)C family spore germination protein n=1 Tax=Clostridium sp. TaxID=1506 RepID=UPI002FCC2ABE